MKKFIRILACITMITALFVGCSQETEKVNGDNENIKIVDTGNEYALNVNGYYYPVSYSFLVGGDIFENLDITYIEADDPYPAQNWYTGQGLFIKANIMETDKTEGQAIWFINAVKEGKTPRNVGIGDNLSTVLDVYDNELFLEPDWIYDSASDEPAFEEVYIYAPASDHTTYYLAFFINDGKVVMLEIADGFELRPDDSEQPEEENKITLSLDNISSGEVSNSLIGGTLRSIIY